MIGLEERLGTGVELDRPAILLEQIAHCFPHCAVIVDHEDGRQSRSAGRGGLSGARFRRRRRLSEAAPDQVHQLLRLHRLVQVQVAPLGDLAQGVGRDVAGEDDGRDLVIERSPAGRRRPVGRSDPSADCSRRRRGPGVSSLRAANSSAFLPSSAVIVRWPSFSSRSASISRTEGSSSTTRISPLRCALSVASGATCRGCHVGASRPRSGTSTAKTEPLPGRERTSTAWPNRSARRSHDGKTEA